MTTTAQPTTTWPEGVISRYLTLGQATVGIRETGPRDDTRQLHTTVAKCTGCGENDTFHWEDGFYDYSDHFQPLSRQESVDRAETRARDWAQQHAERCRAMPRPGDED